MDLATARDCDLDFCVPFSLSISRAERLRAFVISFDVLFGGCGITSPVTLTTATAATHTHWKQTVLWLSEKNRPHGDRPLGRGDVVAGTVRYRRMDENPRDYQITLTWSIERSAEKIEGGDMQDEKEGETLIKEQVFFLCA